MRAVLVDTGPLYALADPDDRFHSRATEEMRDLAAGGQVPTVAFPVLLEAHTLVMRRLGLAYAHHWLDQVANGVGLLNPRRDDYLQAAGRLGRYRDQAITLVDSVVATLAEQLAFPVWTYDHHFGVMEVPVWYPRGH